MSDAPQKRRKPLTDERRTSLIHRKRIDLVLFSLLGLIAFYNIARSDNHQGLVYFRILLVIDAVIVLSSFRQLDRLMRYPNRYRNEAAHDLIQQLMKQTQISLNAIGSRNVSQLYTAKQLRLLNMLWRDGFVERESTPNDSVYSLVQSESGQLRRLID